MMEVVRFRERPADWDVRIRDMDGKTLFHESCWHEHLRAVRPEASMMYCAIMDGAKPVGYFCALSLRKLLLPVVGSPLPGTGTNYMGPVLEPGVDQAAVVHALLSFLRRSLTAHVELTSTFLEESTMTNERFSVHRHVTHVVPLGSDEASAWKSLKGTARNRINKAIQGGLVAEVVTDPAIADQFFEQFIEVYAKQGMVVPFGADRPRSLFAALMPAGRLLPIRVRNGDDVIAAGLFPFDERCVYFWGAASWLRAQALCPNELLHWTVIREAIARRVPEYNMCGGTSQFKDKFGGSDIRYIHYTRSFLPLLSQARRAYAYMHYRQLKLRGSLGRVRARKGTPRRDTK